MTAAELLISFQKAPLSLYSFNGAIKRMPFFIASSRRAAPLPQTSPSPSTGLYPRNPDNLPHSAGVFASPLAGSILLPARGGKRAVDFETYAFLRPLRFSAACRGRRRRRPKRIPISAAYVRAARRTVDACRAACITSVRVHAATVCHDL